MLITFILMAINLFVFVMIYQGKLDSDKLAMSYHTVFNQKDYKRLLTAAFSHVEIWHILCNMYSLYNLGGVIESLFGSFGMLIIYFVSMIIGGAASLVLHHKDFDDYTMSLGASGAICGLLGAYFALIGLVYGVWAIKSILPSMGYLLILSFLPGVDGKTHICCLACGIVLGVLLILI